MPVALGFADASPAAALAPEAVPDVKVDGIIMVTGVREKCGQMWGAGARHLSIAEAGGHTEANVWGLGCETLAF